MYLMVSTSNPEIMSDSDLRINEKRWRRKRLFRERRPHPAARILALLLLIAVPMLLGVWLELFSFDLQPEGLWQ